MARFDYSGLKGTADRLINRFGRDAVLIKPADRDSSADPWDDPPTPDESDIVLVELQYSMTNRNETLIQQGDKMLLVSSAGKAPAVEDKIKLDGSDYQVVDAQPLNPGGTVMLHEVQARK